MNYENGTRSRQKCNRGLAAILAAAAVMGIASCGSAGRLSVLPGNLGDGAKSAHEAARDERADAVARARETFEAAAAAGAEWASPYDYYLAEEFLALAKEELDSGDVHGVAAFAAESEKHAALAMELVRTENPKEVRP